MALNSLGRIRVTNKLRDYHNDLAKELDILLLKNAVLVSYAHTQYKQALKDGETPSNRETCC